MTLVWRPAGGDSLLHQAHWKENFSSLSKVALIMQNRREMVDSRKHETKNDEQHKTVGMGGEPLWRASNWYSTSSKIKPARFSYGQQPDKSPPEIGPGRFRIIC